MESTVSQIIATWSNFLYTVLRSVRIWIPEEKIRTHLPAEFKVGVKSIVRIDCIHIINVRNALLKHITKTVNYVVLNCGVRPLNSFSPFS